MARIKINFSGVEQANTRLNQAFLQLEQLESELTNLQRHVDSEIQSRYDISSQLNRCKKNATVLRVKSKKIHTVVSGAVNKYRRAEAELNSHVPENLI